MTDKGTYAAVPMQNAPSHDRRSARDEGLPTSGSQPASVDPAAAAGATTPLSGWKNVTVIVPM